MIPHDSPVLKPTVLALLLAGTATAPAVEPLPFVKNAGFEEGELRIYTTTIPATDRRPCLMTDPIYRIDVAHAAMGYTQVPMLSYDVASGRK